MNRLYGILFSLLFSSHLGANSLNQSKFEYLVQQKNDFTYSINEETKALAQLPADAEVKAKLKENDENLALLRAKLISLQTQLENQKHQQTRLHEQLKAMQKTASRTLISPTAEKKLNQIKTEYLIGEKNLSLLETNLKLAYRYEALLIEHHQQMKLIQAKATKTQALMRLTQEKKGLNQSLDELYARGLHLQQEARSHSNTQPTIIEKKILLNSQSIDLIQSKLALVELNKNWVEAEFLLQKNPTMGSLESISQTYRDGIAALSKQETILKAQLALLNSEKDRFNSLELSKQWNTLKESINQLLQDINIQAQTLEEDLDRHERALNKQLARRTQLPDLRPASWPYIFKQLFHIPIQFYQYLKHLLLRVYDNYSWQEWPFKLLFWSSLFGVISSAYVVRRFLKKNISSPTPMRLTRRVYRGMLILGLYNVPYLFVWIGLWMTFYLSDVAYSNYELLFSLIAVFVFFNVLKLISRLIFLDKHSYISEHDLHLYQQIKGLLLTGMIITGLMVFGHQYPLSGFIQELFNRLFMLFLLVVSFALWRSKDRIRQLLASMMNVKKPYFRSLMFLMGVVVPLTLLTTALIGLFGYQNLAWTLSRYQGQFLLILAFYVLARGLLIDVLQLFSEWMVAHLYNGWLWIEVFLKPIDKIIRLTLFLLLLFSFSRLIDEYSSEPILTQLYNLSGYVLIHAQGIFITVRSVVEFLAVGALFFWIAKWTKEFCYRWLYKQVLDMGIRNSISAFTQYFVVALGFFITVRVLGIDFTGLSLVLGGLAVGMGFGLRDFASNVVGGLMLLIERPVREGDLVTIGEHEGRVAHIGIRSMRVSSWDNMEVLIPNAETFNKPFTNWTHQDSIVRTAIPIKMSRQDDPHLVQRIIMEVLTHTPEILSNPPPQAFFTQIDEALIGFEVRYFINVNIHTRFEVRSKVLFALSDRFKEAGIHPPIPPMTVEILGQTSEN